MMEVRRRIESIIPNTSERVSKHTSEKVNDRLHYETLKRLDEIGFDRNKIEKRLREIDREWDMERKLEANAATFSLVGLGLGVTVDKKWFAFPAIIAGFLFQHALQGWCPPVPIFRRLGTRTQREIDNERIVLLARAGVLETLKNKNAKLALGSLEERY